MTLNTTASGYTVRMLRGSFTWTTPGKNWKNTGTPVYTNTFNTLQLKYDNRGNIDRI